MDNPWWILRKPCPVLRCLEFLASRDHLHQCKHGTSLDRSAFPWGLDDVGCHLEVAWFVLLLVHSSDAVAADLQVHSSSPPRIAMFEDIWLVIHQKATAGWAFLLVHDHKAAWPLGTIMKLLQNGIWSVASPRWFKYRRFPKMVDPQYLLDTPLRLWP